MSVWKVISKIILAIVTLLLCIIMVSPFLFMISGSFKTNLEYTNAPLRLIPQYGTLENYYTLFNRIPFWHQFTNTTKIALTASVICMICSSLVAYGFTRFEFKGKKFLFGFMLSTLLVPSQLLLVPQFKMYQSFGFLNSYIPMILPLACSAYSIFLVRQVMLGIPKDLFESASIDGCGEFFTFVRIAVPLSTGGIGIVGVLTLMGAWNDFLTPLIYITSEELYTLSIGLSTLVGFYNIEYGIPMAGALMSAIPIVLVLNLVGQKYFVSGAVTGAVKG